MNKQALLKQKVGMFGDRETPQEAFDYAMSLLPKEYQGAATLGMMVYHNTLVQAIADSMEDTDA
jgi:hypothetical protein